MLLLVSGLPGTGKTFFAEHLSRQLNAEHLNTDKIRKQEIENRSYSEEKKQLVYRSEEHTSELQSH